MENLDDFMRHKMAGEDPEKRFEFREEYWLQAETLIAADERRRKRRALILWWLPVFGLLTLLSGAWYFIDFIIHQRPSQNDAQPIVKDLSPKPSETTTTDYTPVDPGRNRETNVSPGSQVLPGLSAVPQPAAPVVSRVSAKTTNTTSEAAAGAPAITVSPVPAATAGPEEPTVDQTDHRRPDRFSTLPLLLLPVTSGAAATEPLFTKIACPSPVRRHNQRSGWHVGANLGASAIARGGRDEIRAGMSAGAWVQRRLSPRWSAQAGLQWRLIPRDFATAQNRPQSESQRFGFGFELEQQQLDPLALHWLELPLTLVWQPHNVWLEGGVAPARLLGLNVQHQTLRYGAFDAAPQVSENRYLSGPDDFNTQLDHFQYKKTSISILAGAGWQLTPRLSVYSRAYYRPGNLLGNLPLDTPIDYTPDRSTFWMDAGLRFFIR